MLLEAAIVHTRLNAAVAAVSEFADAVALLVQLVQDFPDDMIYRSQLGNTLIRSAAFSYSQGKSDVALEQLAKAETHVREILRLVPDHAEALALSEAIARFRAEIPNATDQTKETPAQAQRP